jgi:L-rhamnose mutarotase
MGGADAGGLGESFEFRTFLAAGMGPAYDDFHRAIPGDLDAAMRAAGVIGWRIYRNGTTLTHRVVALDRRRMGQVLDRDPVNMRWQKQVAPYLVEAPAGDVGGDPGDLVWDFSWPTR